MQEEKLIRRQYHQIYVDLNSRLNTEKLFAAVINALHPIEELKVQSHQIVIYRNNREVEVKVGYGPYVQVSTPDEELTTLIFKDIMKSIEALWGAENA
ncbi:MAG: hypothetical protein DRI61_01340 [Chloroflexi bacterium]|nr:MAG: hypothetical protein DRI61_01340 [Chloroflexota bacterium]